MGTHRLPNGRQVHLNRLKLVGTYSGCLEGSAKTISKVIRESLSERVMEVLPPARPLAIVDPPPGELPRWLCVAELESRDGVKHSDPDYNSRLYVCFFTADTTKSVDAMIESILPHVDWEKMAEDYSIMDF